MMNIIKPILVVYTAFLLANVIPSLQIKQTMVVFALTSGVILVSYKDPTLSVMLLIALVINIDFLDTTPRLEDIDKALRIRGQPPMIQKVDTDTLSAVPSAMGIETRLINQSAVPSAMGSETPSAMGNPVRARSDTRQASPVESSGSLPAETPSAMGSPERARSETPSAMGSPSKNHACDKSLIISKQMLANAQTNVYEKKNMKKYPNDLNDLSVNIQGFYDDVSGFAF